MPFVIEKGRRYGLRRRFPEGVIGAANNLYHSIVYAAKYLVDYLGAKPRMS